MGIGVHQNDKATLNKGLSFLFPGIFEVKLVGN